MIGEIFFENFRSRKLWKILILEEDDMTRKETIVVKRLINYR